MDLSMILSPDVGYDDNNNNGQQYSPPSHQRDDHYHADGGYSAAEMQCAVAILQDFQPPSAAAATSPSRARRHHNHAKQQAPPLFVAPGRRGRELIFDHEEEQKGEAEDADAAPSHHSATSGWASGSDLMSKLDLLVQADEMIQSSSSERPAQVSTAAASLDDGEFVRSGVWTRAEEEYAAALIYYFLKGLLPLKDGTTLRKFLAEKLCCNRRRVSMKLATESIAHKKIPRKVGASVFVVAHPPPRADEKDHVLDTLTALRAACFDPAAASPAALENRPRPHRIHDELPDLLSQAPTLESLSQYHDHHQTTSQPSQYHQYEPEEPQYESPQKENRAKQPTVAHSFLLTSSTSTSATQANDPSHIQETTTPKKPQKKKPLPSTSNHRTREPVPELLRSPPGTGNIKRRKPTIIRTGFESVEEEAFVTAMFELFMAGVLELAEGTKLVSYLCSQLACSPKTLSMKLAPRRLGERKFPDNVGSITYMRKHYDQPTNSVVHYGSESIAARLAELRVAAFDYEHATPTPATQPKHHTSHFTFAAETTNCATSERKNSNVSNSSAASPSRVLLFSRSGPWSREEELYAAALIDSFFKGLLEIAEGTTLRAFLSSRLCCNPMRVSKKLASEWIADIKIPKKLGSSTFERRGTVVTARELTETEAALRKLQHAYLHSETLKGGESVHQDNESDQEDKVVVGIKHARQEEPEDVSSQDDIQSLSGKSPKKIRKVLATYSPTAATSVNTSATRRYRVEDEESAGSPMATTSSSSFNERVVPMAY